MQVTDKQQCKINEIAKKYQLQLVLLFGSQVDGRTHQESDVDIAVLPENDLSFEAEVNLNTDLISILGNVDLTNLRKSPSLLMYAVFDKPQILFKQDELIFPTYRAYVFKRYVEAKPLYEETFNRLKEKYN